jgi:tripartite ATP-independent transporter DctP family solute receptor
MNRVAKQLSVVILIIFFSGMLPTAAGAGTTIKIAHSDNPQVFDSPIHAMSVVFKGIVEQETQGQIKVNIFPSAQLGKEREVMEAVKLGSIEAVVLGEGSVVNFFPPMEVLGLPFLFPSIDVAWKVMDGPFGREFKESFLKTTGVRIVGTAAPGPWRNFGTNKPVRKVEDLKGLRIRTIESQAHQAMVKGLGAAPTPTAFGEVYQALKTGIVDGLELPYQAILNMKLDEVIKYLIVDGHIFTQHFLMVNDKWFRGLPPDQQRAVLHAGEVSQGASRGIVRIWEAAGADLLRQRGVDIYFPTEKERQAFKDLGQPPVLAMLRQTVDKKWIDGVLKAVEDASKAR